MKKIFTILLLIVLMFSSCSTVETANQVSEEPLLPINTQEAQENSSSNDVLEIEIDSFNFGYSQEEIRVKVGQTVKVILTNSGGRHDFVIDELDARTSIIGTGETTEVEFTVTQAGEFFYYCSVGSHRAAGMEGLLIVEG